MTAPSLAAEVAALRDLPLDALVERHVALFGRQPRTRHRDQLWRRVAWKLQEQRLGGLSKVARRRLDDLIAEIELPTADEPRVVTAKLRRDDEPRRPKAGTVLTREWRGREVRVAVVERGFEHEGAVYRSLSAVARAITGSHWNGRLFFGLTPRRRSTG